MIKWTVLISTITLLILIWDKVSTYKEQRVNFDLIATDFVDDSDHEVLRVFVTITNHASVPLSIQDIHFLGTLHPGQPLNMLPASWSKMYVSPINTESKYFQGLTDGQKRYLNGNTGAILLPEDFTRSHSKLTDTVPINIPAYSAYGAYLSFQSGLSSGQVNQRLMENSFLITTSRGIFEKTFVPTSRGEY